MAEFGFYGNLNPLLPGDEISPSLAPPLVAHVPEGRADSVFVLILLFWSATLICCALHRFGNSRDFPFRGTDYFFLQTLASEGNDRNLSFRLKCAVKDQPGRMTPVGAQFVHIGIFGSHTVSQTCQNTVNVD